MMIKKLEANDIAGIMHMKDDILTQVFPCDLGQWVQFLMQHVDNPNFFMMGVTEDERLVGYFIAINSVAPPISDCVTVLYSKTAGIDSNRAVLEALIEWSQEKGAVSIDFVTNNVVGHSVYGFKKKATLMTMAV